MLGDKADSVLNVDQKENQGDDYGSREKDLEQYEDYDDDGDEDSLDSDDGSDYEGGE